MKRILNILSCLTFRTLTILNINACDFLDNNSHKSKPLYKNEEWFNGTSSQYEGNIVDNINIMSWKKYHLDWKSFIKKYQLLNFDDKAIIKVETPWYKTVYDIIYHFKLQDLTYQLIHQKLTHQITQMMKKKQNLKYRIYVLLWQLTYSVSFDSYLCSSIFLI